VGRVHLNVFIFCTYSYFVSWPDDGPSAVSKLAAA